MTSSVEIRVRGTSEDALAVAKLIGKIYNVDRISRERADQGADTVRRYVRVRAASGSNLLAEVRQLRGKIARLRALCDSGEPLTPRDIRDYVLDRDPNLREMADKWGEDIAADVLTNLRGER